MQTAIMHPQTPAFALPFRAALAVKTLPAGVSRWVHRRLAIARTVSELEAMTDRELADIGIMRWDIDRVAREIAG